MDNCVRLLVLCVLLCAAVQCQYAEDRAQRYIPDEPKPTPVPILKQINRHNEDGSYTYGYEAADGSFKIETKAQNGEVKGKYGYKDDTGKLRVVEYGANKYGFQPAGEGITVAPPTLVDESTDKQQARPKQQSNRNQYRAPVQQQSQDYDYDEPATQAPQYTPVQRPAYRPPVQSAAPTPPKPAFFAGAAPAPVKQDNFFRPAAQDQYRPAPKQSLRPTQTFQPQSNQHFQPQQNQNFQGQNNQNYQSQNNQNYQPQNNQNYQQQNFNPKPQVEYSQAVEFSPNAVPTQPRFVNSGYKSPKSTQGFSMLDQLLKEFALPQNGAAPLHDITFGSY